MLRGSVAGSDLGERSERRGGAMAAGGRAPCIARSLSMVFYSADFASGGLRVFSSGARGVGLDGWRRVAATEPIQPGARRGACRRMAAGWE
jgi:hypothetical protein